MELFITRYIRDLQPSPLNFPHLSSCMQTPDIAITLPEGGLKLYQPAEIKVSFTNPLSKTLTGGKFTLNGDGYVQDVHFDMP